MNEINDLVNNLNEKMIHPENDTDLLLEELKNIGVEFIDTQDDIYWKYSEQQQNPETSEQSDTKALHVADVSTSTEYEYGAMSTKFKLVAKNKLTAYATMVLHYQNNAHIMVIYSPEEAKKDSWTNFTGQISERLDEVFGGDGSFDKYMEDNIDEIKECYNTIEKIVG